MRALPATSTQHETRLPLFVSIKEAAATGGVSQDFIRDLIASGTLPAARVQCGKNAQRGIWRIKTTDLVAVFSGESVA